MADVADTAHEEASVSRVQCRSCGYTLGSVPRCPECAHTEQVYLFPDTISKAWIVAVVLAVMLGSGPILRVPFMIILEGSVGAWLVTQFSSPVRFIDFLLQVASPFFALWVVFGRRSFMAMEPRRQWIVALIPAGIMLVNYVRALISIL